MNMKINKMMNINKKGKDKKTSYKAQLQGGSEEARRHAYPHVAQATDRPTQSDGFYKTF